MDENDKLRVFICYSRADVGIADELASHLEATGRLDAIIDRRDLPYGEEWQKELAQLIRSSDCVLWLISENSLLSRWCNWELGEVQRTSKRLVPIRITHHNPAALPEVLGQIHVLPAEGVFSISLHLRSLTQAIEQDYDWTKEHTRLADRAAEWVRRGRSHDRLLRGRAIADAERWRDRRPPSAPQPGNDTLDLILQSRRTASRWTRISALAAVAIVAVLSVSLVAAIVQWQSAERQTEIARDAQRTASAEATENRRRTAQLQAEAAPRLADEGMTDAALLLLLDAAPSLGNPVTDSVQIAYGRVLDRAVNSVSYPIRPNSTVFETPDAIYLVDPQTNDIFRLTDSVPPPQVLIGDPQDESVLAVRDVKDHLIVVRSDGTVERFAEGTQERSNVGLLPPIRTPSILDDGPPLFITDDGIVVSQGQAGSLALRVLDISTGRLATAAAETDLPFSYVRTPAGRFLADRTFENVFRIMSSEETLELSKVSADAGLIDDLKVGACTAEGVADHGPLRADIIEAFGGFETQHYGWPHCRSYGRAFGITSYYGGSGGISKTETVINPEEDTKQELQAVLQDLLRENIPYAEANFGWVGSDAASGNGAALLARDLYLFNLKNFEAKRLRFEAPSAVRILGPDAVAVVEAEAGRIVVESLTFRALRPSIVLQELDDPRGIASAAVANCGGDGTLQFTLPDGRTLALQVASGTGSIGTYTAEVSREDRRVLISVAAASMGCATISYDARAILVGVQNVEGQFDNIVFDLAFIAAGTSARDAVVPLTVMRSTTSAYFAGPQNDIVTSDNSNRVLRWARAEGGDFESVVLYRGMTKIRLAEPDFDARRLLIKESLGGGVERGFLYSVAAGQEWLQLGAQYKTLRLQFTNAYDIAATGVGVTIVRLPTFEELVAEGQFELSPMCLPVANGDYRTSPCWPRSF
ncbi:MAG TPA: toll/interleukin-1 receptor domain-containing protein [Devosiaceae bacterium]|jgi:hypothetical protein|nr:toll/interleukin-1 receptor domain-containing protein [Devosiaceae bacterium]